MAGPDRHASYVTSACDCRKRADGRLNIPGQIGFEDPDAVIDIETVGNRAGISLWTREDLQRFEFLRPD